MGRGLKRSLLLEALIQASLKVTFGEKTKKWALHTIRGPVKFSRLMGRFNPRLEKGEVASRLKVKERGRPPLTECTGARWLRQVLIFKEGLKGGELEIGEDV